MRKGTVADVGVDGADVGGEEKERRERYGGRVKEREGEREEERDRQSESERERLDTDIPVVPTCVVSPWSDMCQLWIHA